MKGPIVKIAVEIQFNWHPKLILEEVQGVWELKLRVLLMEEEHVVNASSQKAEKLIADEFLNCCDVLAKSCGQEIGSLYELLIVITL